MTIDTTKGIAGLKGALRYVRAYRDHVFVVKLGGDVLSDAHNLDMVAGQLALLSSLSIRIVVVHGGGPQASAVAKRLGQQPEMVAGRRVTDDGALEVAKMVYRGLLNTDLVAALRRHGVQATGLSGVDGDLLTAHRRLPIRDRIPRVDKKDGTAHCRRDVHSAPPRRARRDPASGARRQYPRSRRH